MWGQALGDGELSLVGRLDEPCFRGKDNALKSRVFEYKTIVHKIKIYPTLLPILNPYKLKISDENALLQPSSFTRDVYTEGRAHRPTR